VPGSTRSDSFEAVVLPQLDAAHNLARWLMRDAAAAEDVLQEALLRALKIVRNTAYASLTLDHGAQLVPLGGPGDDDDAIGIDLPSGEDDPETSLIKSRDRCRARRLIAALPVDLREALVLRELEELSYKEIAEVTRVPIGTVMSRLWRARRVLLQAATEKERR